jgi:hypothetical protein
MDEETFVGVNQLKLSRSSEAELAPNLTKKGILNETSGHMEMRD